MSKILEIMMKEDYSISITLEMPLINCEIELILTWSRDCVIIYTDVNNQVPTITITETNLYVPVVTLSSQDNAKLLPQLKSGFKRTTSWNKYLAKPELLAQNPNLNHLIQPSFEGVVNRLLVLAFENDAQRTIKKRYYIPNVEIKDYNVMIDEKNFFDQSINNMIKTYENTKITTGQGDDYTTGYLLDHTYFKKHKMIAIDLSNQQALDADSKAIQQINFTANLDRANTRFISFLKKQKKLFLNFHKEL